MIKDHLAADAGLSLDIKTPLDILREQYSEDELAAGMEKGRELQFEQVRKVLYESFE